MGTFFPIHADVIADLEQALSQETRDHLKQAADRIVSAKEAGGRVVIVTGSGPNLHEGVTTLIAELIDKGIVDGVTTSSAVVAHEMAGTLDRVRRVDGTQCGFSPDELPLGGHFELSLLDEQQMETLAREMPLDRPLLQRLRETEGDEIIKAAGNMAYPLGYRTERIAVEVLQRAKVEGRPFEEVAGRGADPRTMIGAGWRAGVPVLVTIPQLVGGGGVGLAIGDSLSITERAARIARMMAEADVIVESAVALTQEIHDGPFETFTGHGIWAARDGHPVYSLRDKTLIRFDLDPGLQRVWEIERRSSTVQEAINRGLPKTKLLKVPFRMEMSGFARLPGSLPVVGDIGVLWPILAADVARRLQIDLEFLPCPQQTEAGRQMRESIVRNVGFLCRDTMLNLSDSRRAPDISSPAASC